MQNDLHRALRPVRKFASFPVHIIGATMPLISKVLFLPVHGFNYLIQKGIQKKSNPYNGAKITKVSNYVGTYLKNKVYGLESKVRGI